MSEFYPDLSGSSAEKAGFEPAIPFHRSLRSKEQVHSILDDIPGIGPSRRKALLKKYQSLEAIREASAEDLADTESMNEKAAQAVYEFLHKDAVL